MPKIAHLITGLKVGGAEQMLLRTLPHLEGTHSVYSVIPREKIGEELEAVGVEVCYLNLRSFFDVRVPIKLYRWLRADKPDILVTYLLHADIIGRVIGRLARIPIIVSSIRCAHQDKKLLVWLSRLTAGLANHYIAVSEFVKSWTTERLHVSPEKITVIYNGIELAQPIANTDLKSTLQITSNHAIVTFVGRLDPQKGMPYLIDALHELQTKSIAEFTVLIVGDGPMREELENMVKKCGIVNIQFLGFRRDIPVILSITDIFISPTLFEGISNSIMEAMNAGAAIITTDIPENKELIENNQNGIVVPARNSSALADSLAILLKDPEKRAKLGIAAQETIHKHFTISTTIQQLNELFSNLYVRNRR